MLRAVGLEVVNPGGKSSAFKFNQRKLDLDENKRFLWGNPTRYPATAFGQRTQLDKAELDGIFGMCREHPALHGAWL